MNYFQYAFLDYLKILQTMIVNSPLNENFIAKLWLY